MESREGTGAEAVAWLSEGVGLRAGPRAGGSVVPLGVAAGPPKLKKKMLTFIN